MNHAYLILLELCNWCHIISILCLRNLTHACKCVCKFVWTQLDESDVRWERGSPTPAGCSRRGAIKLQQHTDNGTSHADNSDSRTEPPLTNSCHDPKARRRRQRRRRRRQRRPHSLVAWTETQKDLTPDLWGASSAGSNGSKPAVSMSHSFVTANGLWFVISGAA